MNKIPNTNLSNSIIHFTRRAETSDQCVSAVHKYRQRRTDDILSYVHEQDNTTTRQRVWIYDSLSRCDAAEFNSVIFMILPVRRACP